MSWVIACLIVVVVLRCVAVGLVFDCSPLLSVVSVDVMVSVLYSV